MKANIPEVNQKRIVIVGGGFAGLSLLRKLMNTNYQIVLIDRYNYHQFQPLFYQVATSGLEASAISFPFRKIFQSKKNVFIRMTEVKLVDTAQKRVVTTIGYVNYDYLVVAVGADTNFFGNEQIKERAFTMKSVPEALLLRNTILQNLENILITEDENERRNLMNVVIIGGGPTGVELSGALAEMRKFVLPKDYPELDFSNMNIYLIEAQPMLLNSMTSSSSQQALKYLNKLGVNVITGIRVKDYDGLQVLLSDGSFLQSRTLIWSAGVTGNRLEGINPDAYGRANRLLVDRFSRVKGYSDVFAIGDIALMCEGDYSNGHPQVAQVAIQQARRLARNFEQIRKGKSMKPFSYRDKGSMATVGRHLAVADLPYVSFRGFFAWLVWMFVHLMSIVGVKNRILIFINWLWNYVTFDQSLRLIIRSLSKPKV